MSKFASLAHYNTIPMTDLRSRTNLIELARSLLVNGPHKMEKTPRRIRCMFDNKWIVDTITAHYVWEHPYYPQYYIESGEMRSQISKDSNIDNGDAAFLATLSGQNKKTDQVLVFEKGQLAGLTRLDFGAMDAWFEEDQPIYQHPKDPYKRIDILPSTRKITIKVGDTTLAESTMNMFLFETMLRTRYYMPKTAINWQWTTPSSTITVCPYKGTAEYYNININGTEIKDGIWWYRHATRESALIEGMACFYNEKVEVYVDGVKEDS
ncbi:MAG: hypothetical protein Q9223_000830 [Gallowayella weberi]